MKKSVIAVLTHCCKNNEDENDKEHVEELRHMYCPCGEESWCRWQRDKVTGKNTYKGTLNLPTVIKKLLKPIFVDLSSDNLLSKCLHGQTQNANEVYNQILWQKCPKITFVSREVVEWCAYSAIISYNDGTLGIGKVFENLGFPSGVYFICGAVSRGNVYTQ